MAPWSLAFDHDTSAGLLDDPVHHGEAQPGPFALLLGREKGLKEMRLRLLIHPVASIPHRQQNVRARLDAGRSLWRGLSDRHVARFDRQTSALGHRIPRIDGKIHNDLLNLPRIRSDGSRVRVQVRAQFDDVFPQQPAQHAIHVGDKRVETMTFGAMNWRRLNASSCRVRPDARSAAF